MPKVSSSAIKRIEYDAGLRKLLVIFLETGAYTYFDVPRPVYEQFLDAPSKGQFFNDKIRDRYPTQRAR